MKNKIQLISVGCLSVIIALLIFGRTTPADVVESTIEKIRQDSQENLPLAEADMKKIVSFITFMREQQLGTPTIELKEAAHLKDQAQILATFEMIQYHSDHAIKSIYGGSLLFTLHKRSFFTWEIVQVDIVQEMGERTSDKGSTEPFSLYAGCSIVMTTFPFL